MSTRADIALARVALAVTALAAFVACSGGGSSVFAPGATGNSNPPTANAATTAPTTMPTTVATTGPNGNATTVPTTMPTTTPTSAPTSNPTTAATGTPTTTPTNGATNAPTSMPTSAATATPTAPPTSTPTSAASNTPTPAPTPTGGQTSTPTTAPSPGSSTPIPVKIPIPSAVPNPTSPPAFGAPLFADGGGSGTCTSGITLPANDRAFIKISEPGYTGTAFNVISSSPSNASVTFDPSTDIIVITAVATGNATITVADPYSNSATCQVTVP